MEKIETSKLVLVAPSELHRHKVLEAERQQFIDVQKPNHYLVFKRNAADFSVAVRDGYNYRDVLNDRYYYSGLSYHPGQNSKWIEGNYFVDVFYGMGNDTFNYIDYICANDKFYYNNFGNRLTSSHGTPEGLIELILKFRPYFEISEIVEMLKKEKQKLVLTNSSICRVFGIYADDMVVIPSTCDGYKPNQNIKCHKFYY